MVLNLGPARTVDVVVEVKTPGGETVDCREYAAVKLPAGRTLTALPRFMPAFEVPGNYAVEYVVRMAD